MKKGLSRFEFYLLQLQTLLTKAEKQKNPALWLYQNNARTPLFMLEALAKIYSSISIGNKKTFIKLKIHFKLLEDALGAVDYYDVFAKEFEANKNIPASIVKYLQATTLLKIKNLNTILHNKKWLGNGLIRIKKIQNKLNKVNWLNEKQEIDAINNFYGTSIYKIVAFVNKDKFRFKNVEEDVHELRRKLRWLSIYPQAVLGCIQLVKSKTTPAYLKKYLIKQITTSTFNKMPEAGSCKNFLLLNQNYFYALSWMIAELGKIKDSGLRVIAIKEALQQQYNISNDVAYKKAYQLLGNKQPQLPKILQNAEAICKPYFAKNNLEHLVIGVASRF